MRSSFVPILVVFVTLAAACAPSDGDETPGDIVDSVSAVSPSDAVPSTGAGDIAANQPGAAPAGDGSDNAERDDGGPATIPARFRGEWNADRSACGTGNSETRLRIGADEIRFYESVGAVRDVNVASDRVVVVTAEYTGEGDTWQDERRLTLAQDGNSLTVSGGGDLVRYRCP